MTDATPQQPGAHPGAQPGAATEGAPTDSLAGHGDSLAGHGDGGPILPVYRVEIALIVLISAVMMLLPVLQILARKLGSDIPSAFVFTKHATVWLGFLGALAATAGGRHLGLATSNLLPKGKLRDGVLLLSACVSTIVAFVFAFASWRVVQAHREGAEMLSGNIPAWWSELIVPVVVTLIALRFWYRAPFGWRGRIAVALVTSAVIALFYYGHVTPGRLVWPFASALIVCFMLGAPVFVIMAGLAMLLFFGQSGPISSVPEDTLRLVSNSTLPAIPLLTLAGFVLASGGASQRLVRAFKSVLGWMPGGVALMVICVCALFTTFTGGSGVTILALGGILLPALQRDKYPEGFSLGLVTAAGSLGLLFYPSLPVILYGAVAGVDAERLFNAGILPGTLLMLVIGAYAVTVAVKVKAPRQKFAWKEARSAMWAAKLDLGLPLIVIVFFKSGLATIVESAALGALYAVLVELFYYKDIKPRRMPLVFAESATLVGAVVILLGVALGLLNFLVDAQIPELLVDWVQAHFHHQWSFLLALNGLLLVLGSVFEIYAAIIVLAPLVVPLGQAFGVDPVHLGIVFLANLEVGFLFPPMGLNLFLSASRFNKPLPYLYRKSFIFLLIMAAGVLLITYVPALTIGFAALFAK